MKIIKSFTLLTILCLAIIGCSSEKREIAFTPIDTSEFESLNGLEINNNIITNNSFDILSHEDLIFLIADIDNKKCHVYNTQGVLQSSVCQYGKGPYDAIFISHVHYNPIDSIIILDDKGQRKIISFKLQADNSITPTEWKAVTTMPYFTATDNVITLDDNRTLYKGVVGWATEMERVRFAIENKLTENVSKYGKMPDYKDSVQIRIAYEQDNMAVSPDKKKMAVIPSAMAGIIEFFDISDDIRLKHTEYIIEPTFTHNNMNITGIPEGAQYGFLDLCTTNKYVILSYVGDPAKNGKTSAIVIYDWDGNIVKGYSTNYTNYKVSYNESDEYLYSMAMNKDNEYMLVKYKI